VDIKESIKNVALGLFQSSKTFYQKFISKKQVADTALNIVRSAGQKVGQKAIDVASSNLTPKSQQILSKLVSQGATRQATATVPTATATPNLNNLIAVS